MPEPGRLGPAAAALLDPTPIVLVTVYVDHVQGLSGTYARLVHPGGRRRLGDVPQKLTVRRRVLVLVADAGQALLTALVHVLARVPVRGRGKEEIGLQVVGGHLDVLVVELLAVQVVQLLLAAPEPLVRVLVHGYAGQVLIVGGVSPLLVEVPLVLARLKRGIFLLPVVSLGEGARGGVEGDVGRLGGRVLVLEQLGVDGQEDRVGGGLLLVLELAQVLLHLLDLRLQEPARDCWWVIKKALKKKAKLANV